MAKSEEYELVPIKPIKDLKQEINKLREELKKHIKEDGKTKGFTKILNSNLQTKKQVDSLMKSFNTLNDNINNLLKLFEALETEDEQVEGEVTQFQVVLEKLANLEDNHKKLHDSVHDLSDALKRSTYLHHKLPSGVPIVYKKTK